MKDNAILVFFFSAITLIVGIGTLFVTTAIWSKWSRVAFEYTFRMILSSTLVEMQRLFLMWALRQWSWPKSYMICDRASPNTISYIMIRREWNYEPTNALVLGSLLVVFSLTRQILEIMKLENKMKVDKFEEYLGACCRVSRSQVSRLLVLMENGFPGHQVPRLLDFCIPCLSN